MRGIVLGLAVLAITVAGHAGAAGGRLPDPLTLLVLSPLAVTISVSVAGRRRGVAWLLAYLVGVQALLHAVIVLASSHPGHSLAMTPAPPMVVLHIAATLACAVVLTIGDEHLTAWLVFLSALTRDCVVLLWAPAPRAVHVAPPLVVLRARRVASQAWQHRGPPALAV